DRDAHLIRRALVLAADHQLNAAVLATRAAAEGGASPAGAVLAGLSALAGSRMMRELSRASAWVLEARRRPAEAARWAVLESGGAPGFGQPAWPEGDPRGRALLAA